MPLQGNDEPDASAPQFRYFVVLGMMLVAVVFLIATPTANWSRGLAIGLEGAALVLYGRHLTGAPVGSSPSSARAWSGHDRRGVPDLGGRRAALAGRSVLGGRDRGNPGRPGPRAPATASGARASRRRGRRLGRVYLSIGLVFAWVIGFIAQLGTMPYFAQHTNGHAGRQGVLQLHRADDDRLWRLHPRAPTGHAIAVIEMLTGQLYLVTVIGLLVGNFATRRQMPSGRADSPYPASRHPEQGGAHTRVRTGRLPSPDGSSGPMLGECRSSQETARRSAGRSPATRRSPRRRTATDS